LKEEHLDGVGLSETINEDFTSRDLDDLAGGLDFRWVWKGARGHSRGRILMGVGETYLEIEESEVGEYYVSMVLRNRLTNLWWELITVYGPAHHDASGDFIAELSRKCMFSNLPMVLGGDFNLIRHASDKNKGSINQRLMDKFNIFIDLHQL
jgi:hypothetical protein